MKDLVVVISYQEALCDVSIQMCLLLDHSHVSQQDGMIGRALRQMPHADTSFFNKNGLVSVYHKITDQECNAFSLQHPHDAAAAPSINGCKCFCLECFCNCFPQQSPLTRVVVGQTVMEFRPQQSITCRNNLQYVSFAVYYLQEQLSTDMLGQIFNTTFRLSSKKRTLRELILSGVQHGSGIPGIIPTALTMLCIVAWFEGRTTYWGKNAERLDIYQSRSHVFEKEMSNTSPN